MGAGVWWHDCEDHMAEHELMGQSDEWYTPAWIFESLGVKFDLDPCCPEMDIPARKYSRIHWHRLGLDVSWDGVGTVWLNPPFGKRNGILPWLNRMVRHGNGIVLVPNRTATEWWQYAANNADCLLFVQGKIRFIRPDGSEGKSPGYGNVLMAFGQKMSEALRASSIPGFRG